MSVARFIDLYLDRHYSTELGLYFTVLFILRSPMVCDVWVAVCQPFVKRMSDDEVCPRISLAVMVTKIWILHRTMNLLYGLWQKDWTTDTCSTEHSLSC